MFGTIEAPRSVATTWLTLLAVAASMLLGVGGSGAATHGETCTDVIVVLDESGSVGTQEASVRSATSGFLSGLAGNGPQAAVVEFGTAADTPLGYTAITTESIATAFDPYLQSGYDSPSQSGPYTNWDDALTHVRALNEFMVAPLVLFVTDGDPTAYNRDGAGEDGGISYGLDLTSEAHARAVAEAAAVEAQGSHILAIGVGGATSPDSLGRLQELAGPNVFDGHGDIDPFAHDVVLAATFSDLGPVLREVAVAMCADPAIRIRKVASSAVIAPGDSVTYTIVVRNVGNVDLVNVEVTDPILPACDRQIGALDVGERVTYECTTQLLQSTTNVAEVTAVTPTGTPVDDDDDATVVVVVDPEGTGTPGYWKNHLDHWILIDGGLLIGDWNRNLTCDARETCLWLGAEAALAALSTPPRGDATYNVARPLVAAWLNVLAYNESSCIVDDVDRATAWLGTHPVGSDPGPAAWSMISETAERLDDYNNGRLCAPHRDGGTNGEAAPGGGGAGGTTTTTEAPGVSPPSTTVAPHPGKGKKPPAPPGRNR